MIPARLNKPEYLFRPRQIVKRLSFGRVSDAEIVQSRLPWGLSIWCRPTDLIGASIVRMGLYDLCVTETLWRLLDPGELAVDVGANIGYMTSVMARRVGSSGTVLSFEPHPEIYAELVENIRLFRSEPDVGRIIPRQLALSARSGDARLVVTNDFMSNRGSARLETPRNGVISTSYTVETCRLDDVTDPSVPVGVMKLDVEGHELEVLEGCEQRLRRQEIRDIVFEEPSTTPTPVTTRLESHGYQVFRIRKGLLKPLATSPTRLVNTPFDTSNYLATIDVERALQRLQPRLWRVLRG